MKKIVSPYKVGLWRQLGKLTVVLAFLGFGQSAVAQSEGYEAFSVLGTSQALCKPGIETGDQLQAFFQNNSDVINQVLSDANWQGNPQDLFDAVAAGEYTENLYEKGYKFDWTSFQDKGVGMAKQRRIWAGEEPFRGFEVNFTSNCQVHKMVIPHACCNVSLVGSSEVATDEPQITFSAEYENARICSSHGNEVVISQADGTTKTVSLDENGCWEGVLEPGAISVTATNTDECGVASSAASYTIAAAPAVIEPEPIAEAPSLIPYIGAFAGPEKRMRYEPDWDKYYEDDADIVGVFGGLMKPLGENWMLFGQLGYANRDGVGDRFVAPNDTLFLDIGVDRYFGKAFVGGGAGLWNIGEDERFEDASLFIHGGSYLGASNFQLYLEGRVFGDELDNVDTDHLITGGVRYLFK